MKRGLLLCVCQGTCPSFHKMDIFEVLNSLRREGIFDWVGLHPQLCSERLVKNFVFPIYNVNCKVGLCC